jgi:hypothetical protein
MISSLPLRPNLPQLPQRIQRDLATESSKLGSFEKTDFLGSAPAFVANPLPCQFSKSEEDQQLFLFS